jgi:hypothetical protein
MNDQYNQAIAIINQSIENDIWTKNRMFHNCKHTQKQLDLAFYHLLNDNEYIHILNIIS